MITFILSIIALLAGYFFYSKFIEKTFGINTSLQTPAYTVNDGVDYVPMKWWRVFLIQFLNIAGLGPIFGAIAGAMWGPVAFVWIVFGAIFAGAVHDYFSGMISLRYNGASITEVVGKLLGKGVKQFMRAFTVFLMIIVGAVFISGPAKIVDGLTSEYFGMMFWSLIIFAYYIVATLLPVDKVIGKIYPIFGFALLFMALGIIIALFVQRYQIPELYELGVKNYRFNPEKFPIFPMLFITIACGAISGFHATQSPLMARCLKNESEGRKVFYGAMISEGIVALIWAAVAMSFFGGIRELNDVMIEHKGNAAWIVNEVSNSLLGHFGAVLALLGVVAAPITSGDTAFRSARLIVADFTKLNQKPLKNRLFISIPLFAIGFALTQMDFGVIWRYFAWANQTLAMVVLWAISVYLVNEKKLLWITLIPAVFMTMVTFSYILCAPEGFGLAVNYAVALSSVISVLFLSLFFNFQLKKHKTV
jgi:carbon starvation protein CstA